MSTPRRRTRFTLLFAGNLMAGAAALGGCKPEPTEAPVEQSPEPAPAAAPAPGSAGPRPPVELIHIEGRARELRAMLDGIDAVLASWTDEGGNWKAQLQAVMLQTGFGVGMLEAIDLDGTFAASFAYPHPGQAHAVPSDAELSISVPTNDNQALIEAMPRTYRPQPLGNGMWELVQGELRYLLRETPKSLQLGLEQAQLDAAGALAEQPAAGRRIQVRAWNIPKDDIDPNAVLGRTGGGDFMDALGEVIRDLDSVRAELDMGVDRDLQVMAQAEAPFDRLPLEVYGAPLRGPSDVASRMPTGAAMYGTVSWGSPGPLHRGIDRVVQPSQVPPPFDSVVKDVVAGVHGVLDGLDREVAMGAYLDAKERGALVVGARIKDEAATQRSMRKIMDAAERAISSHIALVGDDPEYKYRVELKNDALSVAGGKADRMVVTVPKFMEQDTQALTMLLGARKPKLEMYSYVGEGYGFVVMGQGSRKTMTEIMRAIQNAPSSSLESDGGLALARDATDGCSICVAMNVKQSLRVASVVIRDEGSQEGAALVDLADALAVEAAVAFGATVEGRKGTVALGVPKGLLFADREQTRALERFIDYWAEGEPPPAQPTKPR